MNPIQVSNAINQYKNTINEMHQTMFQNKKNMDIVLSKKDLEINQIKEECKQKDLEINQIKEELEIYKNTINEMNQTMFQNKKNMDIVLSKKELEINQLKEECTQKDLEINQIKEEFAIYKNDEQIVKNLNNKNIPFKRGGPFIILS